MNVGLSIKVCSEHAHLWASLYIRSSLPIQCATYQK